MRKKFQKIKVIFFLIIISFSCISIENYLFSQKIANAEMSGANYNVKIDSLNSGGTDYSSSTNYIISDTIGENATGESSSSNYQMFAGYRQMETSYISISAASDVVMTAIGGVSGGQSNGSATWTVITDNNAGYSVSVRADSDPAMQSVDSDTFDDYSPQASNYGLNPDYDFSIANTASAFGMSPEGNDVTDRYKDNGSICGSGVVSANKCWVGLSTVDALIVESSSSNQPTGTDTTVKFRAESGGSHIQPAGDYSATITITAITL